MLAGAAMCVTSPMSIPSCLQDRTLLNVQFDKLVKASSGQRNRIERARKSCLGAQFFQAAALLIAQAQAPVAE